ncbi:chemotaxis sensory transducer [Candidatus Vecturithrix granuli]|uniref:Chemotaxis sensory transducer n=1 Tax=Vecturithrix granuli TaxID=1499967 RepID=A0A081C038_VECG1|nr:chemotaxis sensory transducer [Candidatus Vecturithrix granuli]
MLKKLTISHKQMIVSSILGLGILFIVSYLGYSNARRSMQAEVLNKLIAIRAIKKTQIQEFFQENFRDIQTLTQSADIFTLFQQLANYHQQTNPGPAEPFDISTPEYQQITEEYGDAMDRYIQMHDYHDIYLLCSAHGHVMYSFAKKQDLGVNLSSGTYKESPLAQLWRTVVTTQEIAMQDFALYAPNTGEPTAFLGGPIHTKTNELIGVLAVQISVKEINNIMQQRDGLGKTGEVYLVGPDFLMRSDSFLDPINHTVMASFLAPETGKIKSDIVQSALTGTAGTKLSKDYRNIWILSAYTFVDIVGIRWALLVDIDRDEAFQDVYRLRRTFVLWGAGLFGAVILGAILFARSMTRPLMGAVKIANQISQGDLQHSFSIRSEDEIGQLLRAMQTMAAYIQEAAEVANKISQKNLQAEVHPKSDHDVLNQSLLRMVATLRALREENNAAMAEVEQRNRVMEQQNWLKDGMSQLSNELAGETSLHRVCQKAISFTARYVNAGQGCVYVYDAAQECLKLYGTFAFIERDDLSNTYKFGEGIIGQVALEQKPILLKYVAPGEHQIVSGTGAETPLNIYTLPLIYENELYGVLELASFEPFDQKKQDFLQETNHIIATALFSTAQRERGQELLQLAQEATKEAEQAKMQAEQRAEDARKANVRLEEQQQQLQQQNEEFQQLNAQLEEQREQLEQQREELRQQKEELLRTRAKQ